MLGWEIGLPPGSFDTLSPVEFSDLLEAIDRRHEYETRRLAWAIAQLIVGVGKHDPRGQDLVGDMLRGLVGDDLLETWEARRQRIQSALLARELEPQEE